MNHKWNILFDSYYYYYNGLILPLYPVQCCFKRDYLTHNQNGNCQYDRIPLKSRGNKNGVGVSVHTNESFLPNLDYNYAISDKINTANGLPIRTKSIINEKRKLTILFCFKLTRFQEPYLSTHREIFSKFYQIKPKPDCFYHFPIDLDPNERPLGSNSIGAW